MAEWDSESGPPVPSDAAGSSREDEVEEALGGDSDDPSSNSSSSRSRNSSSSSSSSFAQDDTVPKQRPRARCASYSVPPAGGAAAAAPATEQQHQHQLRVARFGLLRRPRGVSVSSSNHCNSHSSSHSSSGHSPLFHPSHNNGNSCSSSSSRSTIGRGVRRGFEGVRARLSAAAAKRLNGSTEGAIAAAGGGGAAGAAGGAGGGAPGGVVAAGESWEQRFETFKVRSVWTVILVLLFFLILAAGHAYCMLLVLSLIVAIYKEIIQAKERSSSVLLRRNSSFGYLTWYWLWLTIAAVGLPWALPRVRMQQAVRMGLEGLLLNYHSLGVYVAAFGGFVAFIISLQKEASLRLQFSHLGTIFVVLFVVVCQSLIQIANIYTGLIWFILPTSLVIVNDVAAYLCGTAFGKTQLIRLSPKKTLEGYLAAAFLTLLWAFACSRQLEQLSPFICPQPFITFTPFLPLQQLSCTPSPVFLPACADRYLPPFATDAVTASNNMQLQHEEQEQQQGQGREGKQQEQQEQEQKEQQQQRLLLQHQHLLHEQQLALLQQHEAVSLEAAAAQQKLLQLQQLQQEQHPQEQQKGEEEGEGATLEGALLVRQREDLLQRLQQIETELKDVQQQQRSVCRTLLYTPFDVHAMVLGSFAAFFAPFGGFFASGFKRALRIKDFGYFIPGHGGVTDRFDCQVVMGLFTFLYQRTFVPQIAEAEATARRIALLQYQLQQQQQEQDTAQQQQQTQHQHQQEAQQQQQQQQQQLVLQQQIQRKQRTQTRTPIPTSSATTTKTRNSSTSSSSSSIAAADSAHSYHLPDAGDTRSSSTTTLHAAPRGQDAAVDAILVAAQQLSLQQLAALQHQLDAVAAAKAAAASTETGAAAAADTYALTEADAAAEADDAAAVTCNPF